MAVVKGAAMLTFRLKELWVRHKWNPQLPIYLVAICSSANGDFCWVIDYGMLRMATSLLDYMGKPYYSSLKIRLENIWQKGAFAF